MDSILLKSIKFYYLISHQDIFRLFSYFKSLVQSYISSIYLHLDTCCHCPLWTFHLHFFPVIPTWFPGLCPFCTSFWFGHISLQILSMCVTAPHSQLTFAVKSVFSGPLACSPSALLNVRISTHHLLPGLMRLSDCFH